MSPRPTNIAAIGLGCFITVTGVTHFTKPAYYRGLVPSWVPAPRLVAAASGAADCLSGVLLLVPRTRHLGGLLTAALITIYLPAHLDDLRRPANSTLVNRPAGVAARVIANLGYIGVALLIFRSTRPTSFSSLR